MNQILITKKLYVTPELKRKKKMYKFDFIVSIFLICILTSMYIYAEYDRNKAEAESREILEGISQLLSQNIEDETVKSEDVLVVVLDGAEENYITLDSGTKITVSEAIEQAEWEQIAGGYNYKKIAIINIPKINVNYAIVQGETGSIEETEALLKRSPVKFHGCDPNEVGNFCVVGHNYRNTKFFSKVPDLLIGDIIEITDLTGRTISYKIYDKHTVSPDDLKDTTQMTGGKKELTIITCTDDSQGRVIVRCKEVK